MLTVYSDHLMKYSPLQADLRDELHSVHWHLNLLKAYIMHRIFD